MTTLLAPTQLDGLLLEADLHGTLGPFSDFSRLPWSEPAAVPGGFGRDRNADVSFTSQNALVQPLSDDTGVLERGMHLHWALPDPLTIAHHPMKDDRTPDQTRNDFPHVPNRWLVERSRGDDHSRKWIVESDYLWPEGTPWAPGRITFPVATRGEDGLLEAGKQPYRYLGRAYELGHKPDPLPGEGYLDKLIAPGYGEMAFNAVYPNCRNIFGFLDPLDDIDTAFTHHALHGTRYRVYGWYSDHAKDEVNRRARSSDPEALKKLGWTWQEGSQAPDRLMCVGALKVDRSQKDADGVPDAGDIKVVVANTGTEALSAFLARDLAGERLSDLKRDLFKESLFDSSTAAAAAAAKEELDPAAIGLQIEHQLEALHLVDKLKSQTLDLAAKFDEARHSKTFHSVPSGRDWVLIPNPEGGDDSAQGPEKQAPAQLLKSQSREPEAGGLPSSISTDLAHLNTLQDRVDRLRFSIEDQRRAIFAQWHKYITCCYHPDDVPYPQIDAVKAQITDLIASLKSDITVLQGAAVSVGGRPGGLQGELATRIDQLTKTLALVGKIGVAARALHMAETDPTKPVPEQLKPRLRSLLKDLSKSQPGLALELRGDDPDAVLTRLVRLPNLKPAPTPAKPYWQANDPVVLLVGKGAKRSDRHGLGLLKCHISAEFEAHLGTSSTSEAHEVAKAIPGSKERSALKSWPERASACDPWHPILLEWQVSVETQSEAYEAVHGLYRPDCLKDTYQIAPDRSEALKAKSTEPDKTASSHISGRAILTGHAAPMLQSRMMDYLAAAVAAFIVELRGLDPERYPEERHYSTEIDQVLADLRSAGAENPDRLIARAVVEEYSRPFFAWALATHGASLADLYLTTPYLGHADESDDEKQRGRLIAENGADVDRSAFYSAHAADIHSWTNKHNAETASSLPPVIAVSWAMDALGKNLDRVQTQALGGFNEGLLMQEQVLQFDPLDPLGFAENRAFTEQLVREAVHGQTHTAPVPHADFHPLRMGTMKAVRFRLVDSFGRVLHLDPNIRTTHQLAAPSDQHMELTPRITQPARLNLHWTSAAEPEQRSNSHPVSSPLCGWVMPDNFNGGLAIFNAAGVALGNVAADGRWRMAPGRDAPAFAGAIGNAVLGGLVGWLEARGQDARKGGGFIGDFISVLNRSLENIDPEGFESHMAQALTSGRPMALVRLSAGIEVKGRPAQSHGWDALQLELAGHGPDTHRFGKVRVPLRFGAHGQLNDGLVGFWTSPPWPDGSADTPFRTPLGDVSARQGADAAAAVARIGGKGAVIWRGIQQAQIDIVALMDPRGSLHVTTGILPTGTLRLPEAQFAAALGRLELPLRVGPLITPPGRTELPLPKEPGLVAAWIQRDGPNWTRRASPSGGLYTARTEAVSGPGSEIREGWLTLSPNADSNEGDSNV